MKNIQELQATGKALLDFALVSRKIQANMTSLLQTHLGIVALGVSSTTLGSWVADYEESLQFVIDSVSEIVG